MRKLCMFLLFSLFVGSSFAAGFRVALQSAKQQGMGHVGAGLDTGPASIFFNPGAMVLSEQKGISISGSAILSNVDYNLPGTTYKASTEDNVGTPFAAYASFDLGEKLAGGIGVYTPYGNKVEWPTDWAGRNIAQTIDLKTIFAQPTLSYAINDKFGIGAGFIYSVGEVTLERGIPLTTTSGSEPNIALATDDFATGMGFNVGAYYRPTDEISFGANYRSKVTMEAEQGTVTFDNLPTSVGPLFTATEFNAELPLPAELSVGTGIDVCHNFTLAADVNYVFWSEYEELTFNYNSVVGGDVKTTLPQNWSDALTLKLGGNYEVSDKFHLRAGGYYDYSPVPDETLAPITPDADRLGLTGGFSYMPSTNFSIDGSILYIDGNERTVLPSESLASFGQRYKNTALVPGLGINYSFN